MQVGYVLPLVPKRRCWRRYPLAFIAPSSQEGENDEVMEENIVKIARQFYKIFNRGKVRPKLANWGSKMVNLVHVDPTHGLEAIVEA